MTEAKERLESHMRSRAERSKRDTREVLEKCQRSQGGNRAETKKPGKQERR